MNRHECPSAKWIAEQVKRESNGEGGHLFCDYTNNAYYYIAEFFVDPKPYKKPDKFCIQSFTKRNGSSLKVFEDSDEDQARIDKLDNLAQEVNNVLEDNSIDFCKKGVYFFEKAIEASKVCDSDESLKKYTDMYVEFKEKNELA